MGVVTFLGLLALRPSVAKGTWRWWVLRSMWRELAEDLAGVLLLAVSPWEEYLPSSPRPVAPSLPRAAFGDAAMVTLAPPHRSSSRAT